VNNQDPWESRPARDLAAGIASLDDLALTLRGPIGAATENP